MQREQRSSDPAILTSLGFEILRRCVNQPIKVRNNHSSPKPWDGGGSAGRSGFAGLSAKGLGGASSVTTSVSGFERPLFGCDLVVDSRYRHRYRRCRPSVSSVSAIGSGIVDIRYRYRYRLLHASRSSRSFFTETLGWGGSAGRSGFAGLSAKGLGGASSVRYRRC